MVFSLVLHSFFFPVPWSKWLAAFLYRNSAVELVDLGGDIGLPLEIDLQAPEAPAPSPPVAAPAMMQPPSEQKPAEAGPKNQEKKAEKKAKPDPSSVASAAASASVARRSAEVRDPLVTAGKAGAVMGKDPNVSVMMVTEAMRSHPVAAEVGAALLQTKQWAAFFGAAALDPFRDTDRILIAGSQFRDTSKISAVVKFRLPSARVREVVESLVEQSDPPGSWVSDDPPVARLSLDGSERNLVLSDPSVVVMVPDSALAQAKRGVSFPATQGSEAVVASLKYPARALRGLPFTVPSTLQVLRVSLVLQEDGSGDVLLDAADADSETAAVSAEQLTEGIESVTTRDIPFLGRVRVMEPVKFAAEGSHVKAKIHLTVAQFRELARLAVSMLREAGQRR